MEQAVIFRADELVLEGIFHKPSPRDLSQLPAAVVCHPHPLYGGDMDNSVVVAICERLSASGIGALRFNFRGVRSSEGSFGGGVGERSDARAALDFLEADPSVDGSRICLAGYSFGALVALSAVDERVRAVAVVSPPLTPQSLEGLELRCPVLFVFGERDTIAPVDRLSTIAPSLPKECPVVIVPYADHFWRGQEEAAAREVVAFLHKELEQG